MEVRFYQLAATRLEEALPQLLEKALERGMKAVVEAGSPERVADLDQLLWAYDEASFLPHGTRSDGSGADQPVYLTDLDDTPNGARLRFFVDGVTHDRLKDLDLAVVLFSSSDEDGLARARALWRACRDAGNKASYYTQNEGRGWTLTASLDASS